MSCDVRARTAQGTNRLSAQFAAPGDTEIEQVNETSVDSKIINVYNGRNQKLVGSGLLIVDAALEPLRVLKVLVEGLPDGRSGLWLTNFKGIPVARTISPFDLIYLDSNYTVVHCVEISVEGEYEPFRGDPASALVVPQKSIFSSKLRAGDRLLFRTIDPDAAPSPSDEPELRPKRRFFKPAPRPAEQPGGSHFFNSSFARSNDDATGDPLPGFLAGQQPGSGGAPGTTASADLGPASGRLTKSARSLLGTAPAFRPMGDGPSQPHAGMGSAVAAQSSAPAVDMAFSVKAPTRLMSEATAATHSGRLMRTVNLAPAILPEEELETPPPAIEAAPHELSDAAQGATLASAAGHAIAEPKPRHVPHGIVIPIDSGSAALHHHPAQQEEIPSAVPAEFAPLNIAPTEPATTEIVPIEPAAVSDTAGLRITEAPAEMVPSQPAAAQPTAAAPTGLAVTRPAPRPATPSASPTFYEPAAIAPTQAPQSAPGPIAVAAPAALSEAKQRSSVVAQPDAASEAFLPVKQEPSPYPRTQIKASEQQSLALSNKNKKPSWDVRLLYSLFPEFDPSRPPEIRMRRVGEKEEEEIADEEAIPTKLRILCWLYPDLHLDKFKKKRGEERRAVRLPAPGLVAYFFTGGAPRPNPIKDISVTGFYMCTDERWLPGTIIRITLQSIDAGRDGRRDSITVHSRVVRWGPDGGGFEFVLPGFLEQ